MLVTFLSKENQLLQQINLYTHEVLQNILFPILATVTNRLLILWVPHRRYMASCVWHAIRNRSSHRTSSWNLWRRSKAIVRTFVEVQADSGSSPLTFTDSVHSSGSILWALWIITNWVSIISITRYSILPLYRKYSIHNFDGDICFCLSFTGLTDSYPWPISRSLSFTCTRWRFMVRSNFLLLSERCIWLAQ